MEFIAKPSINKGLTTPLPPDSILNVIMRKFMGPEFIPMVYKIEFTSLALTDEQALEQVQSFGYLSEFPEIRVLSLRNRALRDSDLEFLERFSSLEEVCLYNSEITGAFLERQPTMPNLKRLDCCSSQMNGLKLRLLQERAPNLHELNVIETGVKESDLATISLRHLRNLSFSGIKGEAVSGKLNSCFPELRELFIEDGLIEGGTVESLAQFKELTTLRLKGCRIALGAPETFDVLGRLEQLELTSRVDWRSSRLELGASIQYLDLRYSNLDDKGFGQLGPLYNLEYLNLRHTKVTPAIIPNLGRYESLETLGGPDSFPDISASDLRYKVPCLKSVSKGLVGLEFFGRWPLETPDDN